MLNSLGFQSREEFNDFKSKLSADFDQSAILTNQPSDIDKNNALIKVRENIKLSNDEPIIENARFKIKEIDEVGVKMLQSVDFSPREFAYILDLLLYSINDSESTRDIFVRQINYEMLSSNQAQFNFFVDIDMTALREKASQTKEFLPQSLLLNIGFTLLNDGTMTISNSSLKVNDLDETTNDKFISVLSKLLEKTEQDSLNACAQFIADFLSEVFSVMNCQMVYKFDIIELIPR